MLQFKAGEIGGGTKEAPSTTDYSQKGEKYFFQVINEDYLAKGSSWKLKLNHHERDLDLMVYSRPSEGDDHLVRVEVTFGGISMETFKTFMKDIDVQMSEGSNVMRHTKILERDANEMPTALYNCLKVPLMSEREMVVKSIFKDIPGDKFLVVFHSYERDDYPITDERIRVNLFRGMLFWQTEKGVQSI